MRIFKKTKKTEYYAYLVRSVNGIPTKIKEQRLIVDAKEIVFKNSKGDSLTWILNKMVPTLRDGNKLIIFCNMDDEGSFLTFNKNDMPLNIQTLDALITKNMIVGFLKLIKGTFDKNEMGSKLAGYIVVGIMGGALGYIVNETMSQTAVVAQLIGCLF